MSADAQHSKEPNRCCDADVIRTTVQLALSFIGQGLMTEEQALKYFNLKQEAFDHFKAELTRS